jgi:hypothetical protein
MTSRVRLRDWLVGEEGPIDQMEEEEEEEEGGEESGSGQESEGSPSVVSFRIWGFSLMFIEWKEVGFSLMFIERERYGWGGLLPIRRKME